MKLWKKQLLILGFILFIIRIITEIPLPWMNTSLIKIMIAQNSSIGLFNAMTGGGFSNFSILALSITPYITASIVIHLMEQVIPKLKEIKEDGEYGKKYIKKVTLIFCAILSLIEAGLLSYGFWKKGYFENNSWVIAILTPFVWTLGSVALAVVGEWITEHLTLGNGVSIILAANILSGMPQDLYEVINKITSGKTIAVAILFSICLVDVIAALVFGIVILESGVRNIPVMNSGKMSGGSMRGKKDKLPIKVDIAGIAPVIFAASIFSIPTMIQQLAKPQNKWINIVLNLFNSSQWFSAPYYYVIGAVLYAACIIGFSWYYAYLNFNPEKVAQNLKKNGAMVVGCRPGKETESYLDKKLKSMVLLGSSCIAAMALLAPVASSILGVSRISFFSTSLVIVVSVLCDIAEKVQSAKTTDCYQKKSYFGKAV